MGCICLLLHLGAGFLFYLPAMRLRGGLPSNPSLIALLPQQQELLSLLSPSLSAFSLLPPATAGQQSPQLQSQRGGVLPDDQSRALAGETRAPGLPVLEAKSKAMAETTNYILSSWRGIPFCNRKPTGSAGFRFSIAWWYEPEA